MAEFTGMEVWRINLRGGHGIGNEHKETVRPREMGLERGW